MVRLSRAGKVIGPRGLTGAQGAPGSKGADGKDGSSILSGARHPRDSDGELNDLWLDYASPKLNLYKKLLSGWSQDCSAEARANRWRWR